MKKSVTDWKMTVMDPSSARDIWKREDDKENLLESTTVQCKGVSQVNVFEQRVEQKVNGQNSVALIISHCDSCDVDFWFKVFYVMIKF